MHPYKDPFVCPKNPGFPRTNPMTLGEAEPFKSRERKIQECPTRMSQEFRKWLANELQPRYI